MQFRASIALPGSCESPRLLLLCCSTFPGIPPHPGWLSKPALCPHSGQQERKGTRTWSSFPLWTLPISLTGNIFLHVLAIAYLQGPPNWMSNKKFGLSSRYHCAQQNIRNSVNITKKKGRRFFGENFQTLSHLQFLLQRIPSLCLHCLNKK